jgi:ABC-type Fe3+ transport system substrate-binding protein
MDVTTEWTPAQAANELLGAFPYLPGMPGQNTPPNTPEARKALEQRILEAIQLEDLKAERRALTGNDGRPVYDWFMKPKAVIEWALSEEGIPVCNDCKSWYESVTQPKRKLRPTGPRDSSRDEVIAAMAKALGYEPASGKKAAQGSLKAIRNHTTLDEETVKKVIEHALAVAEKIT